MIFKIISATLFSVLFAQLVKAQSPPIIPIYNSKTLEGNTLKIKSDSGNLNITAYKANVIKLTFSNKQEITKSDFADSLTVPLNVRATQNLDDVFFSTDSLWVIVNKYDLSVRFLRKRDEKLLVKTKSYFLTNADGLMTFELQNDADLSFVDLTRLKKKVDYLGKLKKIKKISKGCSPLIVSEESYGLYFGGFSCDKVEVIKGKSSLEVLQCGSPKGFIFFSGGIDEVGLNVRAIF